MIYQTSQTYPSGQLDPANSEEYGQAITADLMICHHHFRQMNHLGYHFHQMNHRDYLHRHRPSNHLMNHRLLNHPAFYIYV
jgi:hypothetical protein